MNDTSFLAIDWALRGGAIALVLLVAGALWRDHGKLVSARLGILFAIGTAAYAICSASGFHGLPGGWAIPLLALSAGNNVVFWLLAAALFDDAFRLRWWHAGLWLLLVAGGITDCLIGSRPLGIALTLTSLGFAALAIGQTVSSWRADLVEGRRRLRLFLVGASSIYIALTAIFQLLGTARSTAPVNLLGAAGLLAIAGTIAWSLLRVSDRQSLFMPVPLAAGAASPPAPTAEPRPDPVDQELVAALERLMTVERAYRQDGLTIGGLAQQVGLPEYRLRRLINQALGYRNFNSFLNYYRILEVKAALADPGQASVPVLTIALDAGFSSLGPFNRAFKVDTGLTPSDYRRLGAAHSGIGEPISKSASDNSNSARRISAGP